jgi:hypothetical protein
MAIAADHGAFAFVLAGSSLPVGKVAAMRVETG